MPKLLKWLPATALLLLGGALQAEETFSPREVSVLAGTCFACHGTDGAYSGDIAPIAGRSYEGLVTLLTAFRADEVPGATVMNRIAPGYTQAEIEAIARYFSELSTDNE